MADHEQGSMMEASENDGPGLLYKPFLECEKVVEKLKLLDYEKGYVKLSSAYRPISRHYFVNSTNVGEQFFIFTTVCGWLIKNFLKSDFAIPEELDEPNTTIINILKELRARGVTADITANRLKSGSGPHCIYVLDKLTDLALLSSGFQWKKANLEAFNDNEDEILGTESTALPLEQSDLEEDVVEAEDFDEGMLMDLKMPVATDANVFQKDKPLEEVLESDTNANDWKLEVERLTPQLKIFVKQDAKDWRMHLEQMQTVHTNIDSFLAKVKHQFDVISSGLSKELDRISTREKHLNTQLEPLLGQYRDMQNKLAEITGKYREASGGLRERNCTLQQITEELNQIKADIEEQGQKNNDAAPIVRIKQALTKMENDIKTFDVQIGAVEYSLMQTEVRQRNWHMARPHEPI